MDHVFNGTFGSTRRDVHWVPEAGDGVFSVLDYDASGDTVINLVDLKTNKTTVLLNSVDVREVRLIRVTPFCSLTILVASDGHTTRLGPLAAIARYEVCAYQELRQKSTYSLIAIRYSLFIAMALVFLWNLLYSRYSSQENSTSHSSRVSSLAFRKA